VSRAPRWIGVLVAFLAIPTTRGDEPELALTDLPAYRAALESKPAGPATPVTFRQLWDHPEEFQGQRVRVVGVLQRRFRQGALGRFPALVEDWATSKAGEHLCLVYPERSAGPPSKLGDAIAFEGTFLRRVRYRGADTARLAPLIVGDRGPTVTKPASTGVSFPFVGDRFWLDVSAGVAVALVVAGALVRHHVRKPPGRTDAALEPAPEFVDPQEPDG
jgi:hypothetical protein